MPQGNQGYIISCIIDMCILLFMHDYYENKEPCSIKNVLPGVRRYASHPLAFMDMLGAVGHGRGGWVTDSGRGRLFGTDGSLVVI